MSFLLWLCRRPPRFSPAFRHQRVTPVIVGGGLVRDGVAPSPTIPQSAGQLLAGGR